MFRSQELTRIHRERLLQNGFLQEVMKGWLISSGPGAREGDSAPWYTSFWEFCARYCGARFGDEWYLSPEQSLLQHAERTVIPSQAIIHSPKGTNHKIALLCGTSLYDLKQPQMPPAADLTVRDGLQIFMPAAAVIRVSEAFFASNPIETQVVLASLRAMPRNCSGVCWTADTPSLRAGWPERSGDLAVPRRRTRSSRP